MPYFDCAATSLPKPKQVADAVIQAMARFGNPSRASHNYALNADRCIAEARSEVATLFGCTSPRQVVFTKNATEALNIAISSIRGHIITTEAEHNSVLRPVARQGNTTIIPVDEKGLYSVQDIAAATRPDTRAVVVAHASNLTGNVAPVEEIGRFCNENGFIFILDAAQTAGLLPIGMEQLGVDAVCFTGHKSLWGPQGTGGLCLAPHFLPQPFVVGGTGSRSFSLEQPDQLPERLEAGTQNGHGIAGLLEGVRHVRECGIPTLFREARRMARLFYSLVADITDIRFYGDYECDTRAPIVSLNIGSIPSSEVGDVLWEKQGIAVRTGVMCTPLLHMVFGTEQQGVVRFSFSHLNTEQEIEQAATALHEIAETHR